jgi:hypothetical protein
MQLALECPTGLLEMVQPFADFDFILADLVLKDEKYCEYYKNSTKEKIVDNSVNELGKPLSIDEIGKAFEIVKGNYLVAPDFLGEGEKTFLAYEECCKALGKEKVIGVIQGSTFEEVFKFVPYYEGILAVPYDLCSQKKDPPWLMGYRRALVVTNIKSERPVHLLGFNSLEEFFWYKGLSNVVSVDTGVPIMLGIQEKDIMEQLDTKKEPTLNRMDKYELSQKVWTAICRNIALLRRFIG